jgi:O-methyltransferase
VDRNRTGFAARRLARALRRVVRPGAAPGPELSLESLTAQDRRIVERALPYTMTGVARLAAVVEAVRYCVRREIPGAFVECGVWRGGSVLAMLLTLQEMGVEDRDVHLYDTFEGMTQPGKHDVSRIDGRAVDVWERARQRSVRPWAHFFDPDTFNEDDVRRTLLATGYPEERLQFARGPVEETLPGRAPERVALLRLDTDWYESTRHELEHLYPRLSERGVLIVDDYGHWDGARRAVDEYFASEADPLLLNWTDYTGRIGVKC